MKNTLLLPRYTSQCNISVFKLFTPIRPKIKHQATCLDLSQKSSSSNTPTSDYYLKHYHQPKCNQPGHKFVDEDQEKTSEQSTRLKIFGPWRLPLCPLLWWWSILNLAEKIRNSEETMYAKPNLLTTLPWSIKTFGPSVLAVRCSSKQQTT